MADAGDAAATERLHEYWVHGEGAAKIRWMEPGDFDRCVHHLGKYIRDPRGYCDLAHKAATGMWPAQHAELVKKETGRSAVADSNKPYGNVTYADPKNGKYPIDTHDHAKAAWAYINMPKNAAMYPMNGVTRSEVKDRIRAAMKKLGADVADSDDDGGRSWQGMDVERRFTPGACEVRAAAEGQRIGGYGAVFGKLSRNLGGFVEVVGAGAFNQAKSLGWPNVVARYNHDPNMVLGTTAGRTLALRTDNVGLEYEVLPPQSRQDIIELVERGDVQFSSFAFRVPRGGDEWSVTDQNYPLRTLHEVQLVDVAPVLDPAYPDATAGLRSLAAAMDAPLDEVRTMAAADELRRFFARTDAPSYRPPKPKVQATVAMMQLMEKRRSPFPGQG